MNTEAILAIGMIILVVIVLFGYIYMILDYYVSNKNKKNFEEDLKLAIKNNDINWNEVKEIALTRNLNQKEIMPILKIKSTPLPFNLQF